MNKIAIIPARAGSKGLKDKNIIDLNGKPLMSYTIEAAISSGLFDKVIVSTDSFKYAEIALKYGAEIIIRGAELSGDRASSYVVIEDVLDRIDLLLHYFVLLQPTSPLRNSEHIIEGIKLFELYYEQFDFLVSVCEARHPKVLCNPIDQDMSLKYFDTNFSNYRRQSFKDYSPNGAIFIGKIEQYRQQKHFFGSKSMAYIMKTEDSVDIDTQFDLLVAKAILNSKNKDLKN